MSGLTRRMLCAMPYTQARRIRSRNFEILHEHLGRDNELATLLDGQDGPLAYPFLSRKLHVRERLIKRRIFAASYWPGVRESVPAASFEAILSDFLVPLPIDQRYGRRDMMRIIDAVLNHIS